MTFKYHLLLASLLTAHSTMAAVTIQSRIDDGAWQTHSAIYPLKGQQVTLKVSQVPSATVRWYQIFPNLDNMYNNANFPWEKNPYQWAGFGKIDYQRQELTQFRNQWQIRPFESDRSSLMDKFWDWWLKDSNTHPPRSRFYQPEIGSFWFQVEIEKQGKITQSPGIEDSNSKGLSPKVFRVSIKNSDDYVGYLTTYFNVPGIFGSTTYQSNHYIGVDCADVLVAAYGQWKGQPMRKNYNVAMLVTKLPKRSELDIINGQPSKPQTWNKHVYRGDFIAVKYAGARSYQHIGVLAGDSNENGILDGEDLVIHAGPLPLHYSYLKDGSFEGHAVILKHSKRLLKK